MTFNRQNAVPWLLLLAVSAAISGALTMLRLPAALLLGPMIGGIILGTRGTSLRIPRLPTLGAQAAIGCLIARGVSPEIVTTFLHDWPISLAALLSAVIASNVLGMAMMRMGILPGTTAIWGCTPGGAFTMILMAEAFGGDPQLVAFMQYTRVVVVAMVASVIARLWLGVDATPHGVIWFPQIHWLPFTETIALIIVAATLGVRLRIPAGPILVPIVATAALRAFGWIEIELPPWFLAISFFLAAWNVGLGFTRPILLHALRALPQIVISMLLLIAFCGGVGVLFARATGVDLLSAYLATSPGGLDSIAIIAASSNVDISVVMTLQTMRLFVMILIGPLTAKTAIRMLGGPPAVS